MEPLKRIAAIVLTDLALELAYARRRARRPFAVIVRDEETELSGHGPSVDAAAVLAAVDELAFRSGVRPGQSVTEAAAFVGRLEIVAIARREIVAALEAVAEVALAFGTTAAIEAPGHVPSGASTHPPWSPGSGPHDTVWLDVSGCARLVGGEDVLVGELVHAVGSLGHRARAVIAGGPLIAQAVARFGHEAVVPSGQEARALAPLPVTALPLALETVAWLGKLGVLCIGDLARLERRGLAHRLGARAAAVCGLCDGRDPTPLHPYAPPARIVELASFEEPLDCAEPLLFCMRGLVARAASRLAARGQATGRVALELRIDPRHAPRLATDAEPCAALATPEIQALVVEPPIPLHRRDEIARALHGRIEALTLAAPIIGVALVIERLCAVAGEQLDLGGRPRPSPGAIGSLVAELGGLLGPSCVGRLRIGDSHRLEARSLLVPYGRDVGVAPPSEPLVGASSAADVSNDAPAIDEPTRLLPRPIELSSIDVGGLVAIDHTLYSVDAVRLSARLEGVEWWTAEPTTRDYARVWLHTARPEQGSGPSGGGTGEEHACALVYREGGRWHLHGWFD